MTRSNSKPTKKVKTEQKLLFPEEELDKIQRENDEILKEQEELRELLYYIQDLKEDLEFYHEKIAETTQRIKNLEPKYFQRVKEFREKQAKILKNPQKEQEREQ